DDILLRIVEVSKLLEVQEVVPLSALNDNNIDKLLEVTLEYLDDGIMYYPKDAISAHPEQFIIAEIIREKIINLTQEELPHSIAVAIEKLTQKDNVLVINVVVFVNRASQKGMIIGKQGQMIKKIGQLAREELELKLGQKVFIESHVKVEKNWRNRNQLLNQLGYIEIEEE
ncbi:MAG TPA: GTPase Era, partial [Erysipelothrix sp.]|nr:GTPase Era [Erysipelothrix sp.]